MMAFGTIVKDKQQKRKVKTFTVRRWRPRPPSQNESGLLGTGGTLEVRALSATVTAAHELRAPLNNIMLLADQLCHNPSGAMSNAEVEYANAILSSGRDLLTIVDDVLNLTRIK